MKNKTFIIILLFIFFSQQLMAENLNIKSKNISIDKDTKLTIFKNEVVAKDIKNNVLKTEYAEFYKDIKLLKSVGETTILTSEGFFVSGSNMTFDNENYLIKSKEPAIVTDLEGNKIFVDKFDYSTRDKFFKSSGDIKVLDSKSNSYNFTQIYIDEVNREIIGSDVKAYLNDKNLKDNEKNKPRVFANTVNIKNEITKFDKSVFTFCDYRKEDKCPPWSLQAKQMTHDKNKKTIYYDNAVIKLYDLPIFYLPKLSHPDPSVDRRSGFLVPSFVNTKNLGSSFSVPYYWSLGKDQDLTVSPRLFQSEHPLFLGEYRKAYKNSNLILDFGHTEGYKKTSSTKRPGSKSHFFSQFIKNFKGKNDSDNNIKLLVQNVSQDKYLKLYKIKSNLVDYETNALESSFNFTHENDNLFFGFKASAYETLTDVTDDKYEYILPELILNKNLVNSNKIGNIDLQSSFKVRNYETNKQTTFLVNDFDWMMKNIKFGTGIQSSLLANIKNVNYETSNEKKYKDELTNELFGAIGLLSELNLYKNHENAKHLLTPKILLRYAPGHMRKEEDGFRLNNLNVFNMNRVDEFNNFENGLSATIGMNYELEKATNKYDISLAQVINEKENKNMSSSSSLNQKFSDVVGSTSFQPNDNFKLNYNFSLDQNYQDINYNEIGTEMNFKPVKIDFSYLEEKQHIGNQEYFKSSIEVEKGNNGIFTIDTKRDLITNSSEYYNLSYEYINDCLRAGLVFRREFYNDSEIEPENSLLFKITLSPLGDINSPAFSQ